ncbi:unnamed protein product [Owenia fusiformis]|uniref:Uncharacterized protein n=1 Tax=Owenia fusiformis TaxID=6347 RepID=A0A8J1UIE4_OWEFU|nr:unnamed protein product [Owenia fusiformis]
MLKTNEVITSDMSTPKVLFSYIERNDTASLRQAIKFGGINPNHWCASDQSPLYYAIKLQYPEIVKVLLENGASPNMIDNNQMIPIQIALSMASACKDRTICTLANCQPDISRTMHYTADANEYMKDQEEINYTINLEHFQGNIWNTQNTKDATYTEAVTIIKHLVEHGCIANTLYSPVSASDPFLKISALHDAAMTLQPEVVEVLLQSDNIDVDLLTSEGRTALSIACNSRQINEEDDASLKIIKTLIGHNCDVNKGDKVLSTPLRIALEKNDEKLCKLLFKAAVEVKDVLYSPLYVAITRDCSVAIVEALINLGCDINRIMNFMGETYLILATHKGRCDLVELLLLRGSNIPRSWYKGEAILSAVEQDDVNILKLFIHHGVDIECNNNSKTSIVHETVKHNSQQVLNYLIRDTTIDLDQVDHQGKTPLYIASAHGHLKCLKLLVENGCDIYTRCNKLFSIFEVAVFSENFQCVEFLLSIWSHPQPIIAKILNNCKESHESVRHWARIKSFIEMKMGEFPSLQQVTRDNIRKLVGQRNLEAKMREVGLPKLMTSYIMSET